MGCGGGGASCQTAAIVSRQYEPMLLLDGFSFSYIYIYKYDVIHFWPLPVCACSVRTEDRQVHCTSSPGHNRLYFEFHFGWKLVATDQTADFTAALYSFLQFVFQMKVCHCCHCSLYSLFFHLNLYLNLENKPFLGTASTRILGFHEEKRWEEEEEEEGKREGGACRGAGLQKRWMLRISVTCHGEWTSFEVRWNLMQFIQNGVSARYLSFRVTLVISPSLVHHSHSFSLPVKHTHTHAHRL